MNFSGKDLQQRGLIVPDCVQHRSLHLGERYTFALLVQLCGEGDRCWPSQRYLSTRLGVSVRSVQNYLNHLEKFGFIAKIQERDGETNTYRLLPHPLVQTELSRRRVLPVASEKASEGTREKPALVIKKEEKNTPLPPSVGEVAAPLSQSPRSWKAEALAAFDRLWAAWPIREARIAALRWWMRLWRLGVLPPLETILRLIQENQARNPRWLRGFVPFLVTWLKERRWEDAVSPTPALTAAPAASSAAAIPEREPRPSPSIQGEDQNPKPLGLQGEKPEAARTVRRIPEGAWRQLNAALAIWPGSLTDAELSRVRGLWMYLHSRGWLPAQEVLLQAAKAATQNFSRWLHAYQFKEMRFSSAQICEAEGCCAY
ncbi:hypothetical protein DFW101_2795 [Solidesulfovibrio carbinoliphilus subsp. oakridgensis]|uniref:Helix-turn-helix domain-containing protein n=1 Tax=Solidesulfovibrio carbinoliphilus subsp. oakridgensis TaxID=694327 RepID=G7QB57_9BACT|nr:helix-turn-helix domain-containing protein [Solidesulfovibrio carbinoliphilus]EHJ48799.1 hypothetical protein DFW101_2795 [Solidesulfovibrio carbinoliphilus subsp. oakridgensis]